MVDGGDDADDLHNSWTLGEPMTRHDAATYAKVHRDDPNVHESLAPSAERVCSNIQEAEWL